MDSAEFDLIIVGAGPGGYVAAIRAAQLGRKVALVERQSTLGGTCLNVGCIPSKALLSSSGMYAAARQRLREHGVLVGEVALDLATLIARKNQVVEQLVGGVSKLMKKNKVTVVQGSGRLLGAGSVEVKSDLGLQKLQAKDVILATGSIPTMIPLLPFDGTRVVTSTEALSFDRVPAHLIVVGAGAIGLELGLVWRRLGAKVTVVELLPNIAPSSDRQVAKMLMKLLQGAGLEFLLETQVLRAEAGQGGVNVEIATKQGERRALSGDKVLVSIGRKPCTEGLGLAEAGVRLDSVGRVEVDELLQTSVTGVYAIGDLIRGPMLAHRASDEGVAVVERLAGIAGAVSYDSIPSVIYSEPELAQVGLTEEQVKDKGLECKVGRFYFRANGRALCAGEAEGMVKVIADARTDRLLGVHILGPHAAELIAEAVAVMEFGGSSEDLARIPHAHPTLMEALKEAALAVDGRPIHA